MALPDNPYIVTSDVDTYFVNKDTGLPLANGLLYFYKDSARTVKKPVYQISGNYPSYTFDTPFPNPITLSAVGTVQNASGDNLVIYYKPYDADGNIEKYYVVCTDQNGVEQFTRTDWPNIASAEAPTPTDAEKIDYTNQISNPTFNNILINDGIVTTYTVSADTNKEFLCAPDWTFVISGTGTVKVKRTAIAGSINVLTNPPYVLDVEISSGITDCKLRQRFFNNSGLWSSTNANDVFLNGSFLAKSLTGSTVQVRMLYSESVGNMNQLIVDGSVTSIYSVVSGTTTAKIPQSLNTDPHGYVDIFLSFLENTHVEISSIQLIPTTSNVVSSFPMDFDSSNRNEAYQGDYYIPRLNDKRIPSYLVGWDFPLNPSQFGSTGNASTTAAYILDQTISVCTAGTVAWSKNANTSNLEFLTSNTSNAFCLIQYLDGANVKEMLNTSLALNISASQSAGTAATIRAYLFTGNTGSTLPTLSTIIGNLNSDGTFSLTQANWSSVPRGNIDAPTCTLTSNVQDYGFSGWQISDLTAQYFAIVVTCAYTDTASVIDFASISLVPGDIPSRPAIKSYDEVLRQCQYYYEKSYEPSVSPGTITAFGAHTFSFPLYTTGGRDYAYLKTFPLQFQTVKRILKVAGVTFYSLTVNTPDQIDLAIYINGGGATPSPNISYSTNWGIVDGNIYGFSSRPKVSGSFKDVTSDPNTQGVLSYHYVVDARLGVIS